MEDGAGEAVHPGEDGAFALVAGHHAAGLEEGEDEVLKGGEAFIALALGGEFLRAERLVGLQGLDGEGPGNPQLALYFLRLVVKRFLGGRFIARETTKRDSLRNLVNKPWRRSQRSVSWSL